MLSIALEEQLDLDLNLDTFLDELSFGETELGAEPMLTSPPSHPPATGAHLLGAPPQLPMFSSPLIANAALPQDPDLSAMDDSTMSMDDSR